MSFRAKTLALWLLAVVIVALSTQTSAIADGTRYRDEIFSTTVTSNIAYGQAPDENGVQVTLLLDLYQPSGDTAPSRPAFIWIHGGGFTDGDKASYFDADKASTFAKRGYVAISINYRLRPGHYFVEGDPELAAAVLDAQHDAQAAVRWLRANASTYRIDTSRIAVAGYSAGAITSLQVAYNSSDPGDSGNPGYPSDVFACLEVSGGMDTTLMDAGEPPALVVHGTADERVAYHNALDVVARASEVGVRVEFHPIDGAGHDVWSAHSTEIIGWMSNFLWHLIDPYAVGGLAEAPEVAGVSHDGSRGRPIGLEIAEALTLIAACGYIGRSAIRRQRR